MATWPSSLPQKFNQSGFSDTFPDNTISSTMSVGPDKRRQRDVSAPEPIQGQMILTEAQYATLKAFHVSTLGSGSLPFDWEHPITGDAAEMVFTGPPKVTAQSGDYYVVTLNMEVLT